MMTEGSHEDKLRSKPLSKSKSKLLRFRVLVLGFRV